MLRLFLISFLCALFIACSSNDSDALKEWFDNQGIATSYGSEFVEIGLNKKHVSPGYNDSAYIAGSFAALGIANNIKQSFYIGLETTQPLPSVWKLRADSLFYADIYKGNFPNGQMEVKFSWLEESKIEHDTTWVKFAKEIVNSKTITIAFKNDTLYIQIPKEIEKSKDTLRLLVNIEPISEDVILRLARPNTTDIPGFLRIAQKSKILEECNYCLHSGIGDSLNVSFEMNDGIKNAIDSRTVVFAQLVFPIQNESTENEFDFPIPVYAYSAGVFEPYRVDTAFVREHGHPNLVFAQNDSLRLQVTHGLRRDSLAFTLRLGNPVLKDTLFLYNISGAAEKVISDRPAYSRYDFGTAFDNAKLKLWLADYGKNKK